MKVQRILPKSEVISLHRSLEAFKNYCEANLGFKFPDYSALEISSEQTHRSTDAHKEAIWVLSKEIVNQMRGGL